MVLALNSRTEEEGSVVDEIGRVLGEIQQHEIKIQAHNAAQHRRPKYRVQWFYLADGPSKRKYY